jgi:hypothetical protein
MSDLVPLSLREYVQRIALSVPTGVNVFVAGGAALDIHRGVVPNDIDLFVTGCDLLTEDKHYSWRTAAEDNEWLELCEAHYLTFFGHEFDEYQSGRYNLNKHIILSNTYFEGMKLQLICINPIMSIGDVTQTFDMDICKAAIPETSSLEWWPVLSSVAEEALRTGVVNICDGNDTIFGGNTEYKTRQRVEKYKKKFPGFRFVKEY